MTIRKREWTNSKNERKSACLVDYRDVSGKRRAKQFSRKKSAEAWSRRTTAEVLQGTHTPDAESITVAAAGANWIQHCKNEGLEPSSIATYEQHVRLHITPLLGNTKLSQLTGPRVEEFRDEMLRTRSRATARKICRSLSTLISVAKRRGLVAQNVASGMTIRKTSREEAPVIIPSKAEVRAFLSASARSSNPMHKPLAHLMVFSGLRASELRGMPWWSLDLIVGTVTIRQRADRANVIGPPKSKAGYRTIPLPPLVIRLLRQWRRKCPKNDLDLVFPSAAGTPLFYHSVIQWFLDPVLTSAGIVQPKIGGDSRPVTNDDGKTVFETKYAMNSFRHCAASLWIEHRVDAKRIQTWMGHANIQLTFDTYGHLFKEAETDAAIAATIQNALLGKRATRAQHRD